MNKESQLNKERIADCKSQSDRQYTMFKWVIASYLTISGIAFAFTTGTVLNIQKTFTAKLENHTERLIRIETMLNGKYGHAKKVATTE